MKTALRLQPLAVALLLACTAPGAVAQWTGRGPASGAVRKIVADPNVSGRVYAIGDGGVFRSDDAGRSWSGRGRGLSGNEANPKQFIADADVPGRLYLIDLVGQLFRSDDAASTWTATGFTLPSGSNPGSGVVLQDVPGSQNSLLLALPDGYLLKSTDNGASFEFFNLGLLWSRDLRELAFDPANPQVLYGATEYPQQFGGAWVVRSSDAGATWEVQTPGNQSAYVQELTFLGDGRLIAIYNDSISISEDSGRTWLPRRSVGFGTRLVRIAQTGRLFAISNTECLMSDNEFADAVACTSGLRPNSEMYPSIAAVADATQGWRVLANDRVAGIYAFSSAAAAWAPSNTGLNNMPVRGLALLPGRPQTLLAGRYNGLVADAKFLRSNDRGASWTAGMTGLTNALRYIEVDTTTLANPGGVHLYGTGQGIRNGSGPLVGGIYKSVDGGSNWVALDQGLPPNTGSGGGVRMSTMRKIKLDPRSCTSPPAQGACTQGPLQIAYALGSSGAGAAWSVVRSTAAGANWTPVGSALPSTITTDTGYDSVWPIDLEFDAVSSAIYVATFGVWENDDGSPRIPAIRNGVFRSDNRGTTWSERSNGLPLVPGSATTHQNVYALVSHPGQGGVLWASSVIDGGASRIYKTLDGGANWFASGPVLDNCDVRDLQVDALAPNVVFASGHGVDGSPGCVWRSLDGGASWTSLGGTGLPVTQIHELRQDPNDRQRVVLSTDRGVWEGLVPVDRIFSDREI